MTSGSNGSGRHNSVKVGATAALGTRHIMNESAEEELPLRPMPITADGDPCAGAARPANDTTLPGRDWRRVTVAATRWNVFCLVQQSRHPGDRLRLSPMASLPTERQCPMCDSRRVRPMAPRPFEATSLRTWYECLRCPHIWFRERILTSWVVESPERQRRSTRAGQVDRRGAARTGSASGSFPKAEK